MNEVGRETIVDSVLIVDIWGTDVTIVSERIGKKFQKGHKDIQDQLRISKEKDYSPSQASPCLVEKQDLQELAVQKLIIIAEKLFTINEEAHIKVNYCSSNCLMTSHFHQKISTKDLNKILTFRRPFLYEKIDDIHSDRLCNRLRKIVPKSGYMFNCLICSHKPEDNDKASSSKNKIEDPSTLAEDKGLFPKIRSPISVVHLGAIKILLKAEFQEGIDSPIKMALIDNRINDRRDCILGAARGDKVFSLTYVVAYALTNSHHSIDYKKNEYIKLDDVFSEIGSVEEKQFSDISPLDNSWAIDIAKNKPILGQKPRMSFRGRTLEVGESSNTSNKELLHSIYKRVDDLCQNVDHLVNIKELLEDFDKNIKPQIGEILRLLKIQHANHVTDNIEAATAKIITELKATIQECPCNHEILEALKERQRKGKEIITTDEDPEHKSRIWKYSYPNYSVGNEELGTGKNPGSLAWPFGVDKKST
ncbi:hypothetical protein AgCh_026554 [Apium graveolens]